MFGIFQHDLKSHVWNMTTAITENHYMCIVNDRSLKESSYERNNSLNNVNTESSEYNKPALDNQFIILDHFL